MRRVTTTILKHDNHILMLKKPRRGWYAMPGGKMEHGELVKEAAEREFREETGLQLVDPVLRGIFTFLIKDGEEVVQEWMMFTFLCNSYNGSLVEECAEGELEWIPLNEAVNKPMAEGDRRIFKHLLHNDDIIYGTFTYTPEYELIDQRLDPSN